MAVPVAPACCLGSISTQSRSPLFAKGREAYRPDTERYGKTRKDTGTKTKKIGEKPVKENAEAKQT